MKRVSAEPEQLTIPITEHDSVSAVLYAAPKKDRAGITVILGHGAGANQLSPFIRLFAEGLAQRGLDTMTFNFLYMEQGRRVPDQNAKLEATFRAIIEAAINNKKLKGNRVVIGGKSMGGRIASQVAAGNSSESGSERGPQRGGRAGVDLKPLSKALKSRRTPNQDIAALVFLGYPLHPPGRPDKLRDAHLKKIPASMLFVQGSRDAFGSTDEIRGVIKRLKLPATLYAIEGGDHSLKVPKSSGLSQPQVYESVMDEISRWLKT